MDYNAEADHIETIDPANPGADFNNDSECFESYCSMQANGARRARYYEASERIAECETAAHSAVIFKRLRAINVRP